MSFLHLTCHNSFYGFKCIKSNGSCYDQHTKFQLSLLKGALIYAIENIYINLNPLPLQTCSFKYEYQQYMHKVYPPPYPCHI